MLITVLAGVLILAVIFFQAVQGLFSAMITAILSILAAVLALNYFEPLAETMLGAGRLGDYAYGMSLLVLFAVPLIVLRVIFDRLVRGNVVLGLWADRAGGAAVGTVTAMVLVGVASVVVQLLPFPGAILGYSPYQASLKSDQAGPPMWAANFTLGLAKHLSGGALSPIGGEQGLETAHRNLTREAFCLRSRPAGGRMSAPLDAFKMTEAFRVTTPAPPSPPPTDAETARVAEIEARGRKMLLAETPRYALLPLTGDREIMVFRVKVSDLAADRKADDKDAWWRLPAGHFRLIADDGRGYYPLGYLTFCGRWRLETVTGEPGIADVARIAVERPWTKSGGPRELTVDWVYSLPTNVKPTGMVFRMAARSEGPPLIEGMPRACSPKTGNLIALGVAAAKDKARFEDAPPERILQPESIECENKLARELAIRVGKTQSPDGADPFELDESGRVLKRIRFSGPTSNLIADSKGALINKFLAPKDHDIVTVHCKANPKGADNIRELANSATPELILDNRELLPHRGAYLTYESGGALHTVFTFDADLTQPARKLDAGLAAAWEENLANVKSVGFIFVAPVAKSDSDEPARGAAGLKLTGDPRQEFYLPQPVALEK